MRAVQRAAHDTLAGALVRQAELLGEQTAYVFLEDGEDSSSSLSYVELHQRACNIAAVLRRSASRGDRAVLLYPPGLDYIAAFFGCLYAGVVAVPAYPPDPGRLNRTLPRVQAIVADAQATVVLTTAAVMQIAEFLLVQAPELRKNHWIATDRVAHSEEDPGSVDLRANDVAFLQYTSGSTGVPRGVILTHEAILHNLAAIAAAFDIGDDSVGVSWLPPYHDMGLIGGILAPLYRGRPTTLMSPISFLQKPSRWLRAITRNRATISGGPNFAYELCVRKISPEERSSLDLSSWELAFSGAEPVRSETIERFAAAFAPHGFRRQALYPCYGLAEATLLVTGGPKERAGKSLFISASELEQNRVFVCSEPSSTSSRRVLVGCGQGMPKHRCLVVKPETRRVAGPNEVGEVWVSGPSVAAGYWQRRDDTESTFRARLDDGSGPFLRTGDLGFLHEGELFVTGRLKDLLIIRGRNHYPQDIEQTVEASHGALRKGCCAAFTIEIRGDEELVVAVEVDRRTADQRWSSPPGVENAQPKTDRFEAICEAIRQAVTQEHDLHVHDVVLLRPGAAPKTSSGKIQRRECKTSYSNGSLDKVASSAVRTHDHTVTTVRPGGDIAAALLATPPAERPLAIRAFLQGQVARILKTDITRVDPQDPVNTLGMDSMMAVELSHRIEKLIGVPIPATAFLREITLDEIADHAFHRFGTIRNESPQSSRRTGDFRLSENQESMWFLQTLAPQSRAYHLSRALRIRSEVDPIALRRALEGLVERHGMLRTSYALVDGRPVQHLGAGAPVPFDCIDAAGWSDEELRQHIFDRACQPFDLEHGPILRVSLWRRSERDHVLALAAHHIALDLWSLVVMLSELKAFYAAARIDRPPALPRLDVDYFDFVAWQEAFLVGPAGHRLGEYWRSELTPEPAALDLPLDRPRPRVQTYTGSSTKFTLTLGLTEKLRALARSERVTTYVVLATAFSALLSRYCGQSEVVVGTPIAGRSRPEFSRLVGYFVNPVVLRTYVPHAVTFRELMVHVRSKVIDALEHQDLPIQRLARQLSPTRGPDRPPLFQVMFALDKPHLEREQDLSLVLLGAEGVQATLGPLVVEAFPTQETGAPFDVALTMVDGGAALFGSLQYNSDLFEPATIERMTAHFAELLEAMVERPDGRVRSARLVPEDSPVPAAVRTRSQYAPETSLAEVFAARALERPDRIALVDADHRWTFGALSRRIESLTDELVTRGTRPGAVVGVLGPPSFDFVVAILAALTAGATVVVLSPSDPPERLRWILADASASAVVAPRSFASNPGLAGRNIVVVDEVATPDRGTSRSTCSRAHHGAPQVLLACGDDTRPPLIALAHADVARWFEPIASARPGPDDLWALVSSPDPVGWLWDLCGWLHGDGCALVVGEADAGSVEQASGTPQRVLGEPPDGTSLLLLDEELSPAPIGARGQLHVVGESAYDGYRSRPDLAALRYRPCALPGVPGARAFATGILGKRRDDGCIVPDARHPIAIRRGSEHPLIVDGAKPTVDVAPEGARTPLEEVLTELWADVLELPRVDIHDSFFELGGHSLLAGQLASRIRDALPVDVPVSALFENPTVARLAASLEHAEESLGRLERAAELYLKLARLSDADVERILASESG